MKVGDLVTMPVILDYKIRPASSFEKWGRPNRVQVYWIEDEEATWEPKKWLEVLSEDDIEAAERVVLILVGSACSLQ